MSGSRVSTLVLLTGCMSGLVGCDHVSKHLAIHHLQDQPALPLIKNALDLRYVENRDVAFELLRWIPDATRVPLLVGLGALTTLAMFVFFVLRTVRGETSRLERTCGCLLLAGAVGNVVERALRGHVVDFIHVHHWPVFNLADTYIVIGFLALLVFRRHERVKLPADARSPRHAR